MTDKSLTQETLKELLDYNHETGAFVWRHRDRKWFKSIHSFKRWNKRYKNSVVSNLSTHGYVRVSIFKKRYSAHRLAWLYVYGEWPTDEIDHINHIRTDNRICNLREVSHKENTKNSSIRKDNKSGVTGVYWHVGGKAWSAYTHGNGKQIYLGLFENKNDAIDAKKQADKKHGYHENHGMALM